MCPYITKGWASFAGQILTSRQFFFILFPIFFNSYFLRLLAMLLPAPFNHHERKGCRIHYEVCMQFAWPFPYGAYGKTTYLLSIDSLFLLVPFVARPLISLLFLCKSFRYLFNFFEKQRDFSNRSTNWYRLDLVRNLNRLCDLFIEVIVRIDFAGCVR